MCGIIGIAGVNQVAPKLLDCLKRLEYRGYDSSGIAVTSGDGIERLRAVGRLSELEGRMKSKTPSGTTGIGHTRWATHGAPTVENAHPHISPQGTFCVVHNGIIENSEEIKKTLLQGDSFESQTDTEVFSHLLEKYYIGEPINAIAKALAVLKGAYAFGILCSDFPDVVFGASSGSPLVAIGCEEGGFISSDPCAVNEKIKSVYRISGGEICCVGKDRLLFFDPSGQAIEKKPESITCKMESMSKGQYPHFMLKEIYEQPRAVSDTVNSLVKMGSVLLPDVYLDDDFFRDELEKIVIVGCGSAYHTGLCVKNMLESMSGVTCNVEIASEFRYSQPVLNKNTLTVFISQSGETADTLACLRLAKHCGAKILSIVNVKGSVIATESENVIFTLAGREIAVATTKAYSAQLAALYSLAIYIGRIKGKLTSEQEEKLVSEMLLLPSKIEETLRETEALSKEIAKDICRAQNIFFMGRLCDYATACEGALKLKEISYINAQCYPAGELKHGTISLVDEGTPVIAILGESRVFSKTLSNMCETEARGACVFAITDKAKETLLSQKHKTISVADTLSLFRPSLLVIPFQLLSYHTALLRGCDIDKPRNLAKSVTVE